MSFFDLDPTATQNLMDQARLNPLNPADMKPGLMAGAWKGPVTGLASTWNDAALLMGDAATPVLQGTVARPIDQLFGTKLEEYLGKEQQKAVNNINDWAPDPRTTGVIGQAIHGLFNVGSEAILGGPETAAALQGYKGFRGGMVDGLDPGTALGKGAIDGISTWVGLKIPITLAPKLGLAGTVATGAGGNVVTGMATRGATGVFLRERGYGDMADQYQVMDNSAIAMDLIMGGGFGALAHYGPGVLEKVREWQAKNDGKILPSDRDTALFLNAMLHAELDTAPGIPADPAARAAHVEAVHTAINDLLAGRDVNVGRDVTDSTFVENPSATETRSGVLAAVEDHLGADWQSLKIELESRGLPGDTELYNVTGPREPLPVEPVRVTSEVKGIVDKATAEGWDNAKIIAALQDLTGRLDGVNDARRAAAASGDRVRGALWINERLTRAERNGELSKQEVGLAKWLIEKNPHIADDLAISLKGNNGDQVGGVYKPLERLAQIFKGGSDPLTTVHEFLHHTERLMPADVRAGIQQAWLDQVKRLQDVAERTNNTNLALAINDVIKAAMGIAGAHERVVNMVKDGHVGQEFYSLVNASEFWAVNASKIVRERAQEGWVKKAVQWVKELIEKAKDVFGLQSDAAVIRGLDAVLKSDGSYTTTDMLVNDAPYRNVEAPGKGVAKENLNGFEPDLRVSVPIGRMKLPEKPLVLTGTNKKNAGRQIAAIDEILAKFPDADTSPLEWSKMMAYAMATNDVPVPPYRFLKDINSDGAYRSLSRLSAGQIADATHGFENARLFREAYLNKELEVTTTGKLFAWSFLSRGVSPYTQEGLFIDAFHGLDAWVKKAAEGTWSDTHRETYNIGNEAARASLADAIFKADTEAYEAAKKKAEKDGRTFTMDKPTRIEWDLNSDGTVNMTYAEWARTVSPKGSGQPGSGATHNLNAFGNLFLAKMSERVDGVSAMQKMHDMMQDPNMTGKELRRWFIQNTEGVGIDNKVVSFTLLVAGFPDVMVLDRVQIRQLWDDGRFGDKNLYDGRKVNNKTVAGSALSEITYGARGLLIYEAIERALAKRIDNLYASLGRPEDASIGRYHWETWVADSQQEASHGTLDAILHDAKGNSHMIAEVTAKEGEYGAYAYGARYGRDASGPYFLYNTPTGGEYRFTVPAFREFMDAIKSTKNKVVPTGFKVTEAGNAPWFEKAQVNKQALDALAKRYATDAGAVEGAGAVRQDGQGQAVPDSTGRGADPYGADEVVKNNPALTYIQADGTMVPAARALTDVDAEIASAKRDSQGYDAAAACALRG